MSTVGASTWAATSSVSSNGFRDLGEVTGAAMAESAVLERRLDLGADLLRLPAARAEAAAGGRVRGVRHVALEDDALALAALVGALDRHGREQGLRVGVRRPLVHVVAAADLHDLAEVHHGDPVGHVADDGQIVSDEDVREPELPLQRLEQVDHLRSDRDVERGDRLVEDEQLRVQRERARDADPLTLAARELVREPVRVLRAQSDRLEELVHAPALLPPALGDPVDLERLGDDVADGQARVERRVRVLEHDLQLAPVFAHLAALEARDVVPVHDDLPRGRLDQLEDRPCEGGLAAAGLSDEAEGLSLPHLEVDAVDRVHLPDGALEQALSDREVLDELLDAEDLAVRRLRGAGDRAGGGRGDVAHAAVSEASRDL